MRRAVLVAITAVMLAGCSGSTTPKPTPTSTSTTATTTTTTAAPTSTTTTPPSTTAVATTITAAPLEPQLRQLLARYDAAVAAILADVSVTANDADPKVTAFLALFTPDNEFARSTIKFWAGESAKGRSYRPGPSGVFITSSFQKIINESPTEVTFLVCTAGGGEVVDQSGAVIQASGGIVGGEIVALNVNGQWLLRELTQRSGEGCPKPGAGG